MTVKNSQSVYTGSKHVIPFSFIYDEDYRALEMKSPTAQETELTAISTDLHIIRSILYLDPGLDVALLRMRNELKAIRFDPKTTPSFPLSDISFTPRRKMIDTKIPNVTLEIIDELVRIDRFLVLEREWWVPKSLFVGAKDLPDGEYHCRVDRRAVSTSTMMINNTPVYMY